MKQKKMSSSNKYVHGSVTDAFLNEAEIAKAKKRIFNTFFDWKVIYEQRGYDTMPPVSQRTFGMGSSDIGTSPTSSGMPQSAPLIR